MGFSQQKVSLTILYTGNLNGYLTGCNCTPNPKGGLEKMATVVERLKREKREENGTPPILLDTGDVLDRSSDPELNELIVSGYSSLDYDAVSVGNNECAQGFDALQNYRLRIPLTAHNLLIDSRSSAESTFWSREPVSIKRDGIPIVIISLLEEKSAGNSAPSMKVISPDSILERLGQSVKESDFVVLLYHGNSSGARELLEKHTWVDIVVLDNDGSRVFAEQVNSTVLVSPGKNGDDVGVLDITIKNGNLISFDNRFIPVIYDSEKTMPFMQTLVERYRAQAIPEGAAHVSDKDSGEDLTEVVVDYYYSPGCSQCRKFIETTVPAVEKSLGLSLTLRRHDIFNSQQFETLIALVDTDTMSDIDLPVIHIQATGELLEGEKEINRSFEKAVQRAAADRESNEQQTAENGSIPVDNEPSPSPVQKMAAVPVFVAGLIDGVNPCAFVTILFLVSAFTVAGKTRREILITGIFFTAAVFISYLLIGLGLFTALYKLEAFPVAAAVIRYLLVALLFSLAVLSLFDYIQVKRGKPGNITLQLPASFKRRIHESIRNRRHAVSMGGAAFILGFLVSLFELACTGQIYFPTIAYMVKTDASTAGIFYLLLYNVGFIIPLAVVFGVTYAGIGSEKLVTVFNRNLGVVKLLTAGVFVFFGLAMLFLV